jgi:Ala-tRNA(Pro) deacylase
MSIAHRLEDYLYYTQIHYQRVPHAFTETTYDSALSANLPLASVVKAVVLRDRCSDRFVMVLIPASNKLKLLWINRALRSDLVLAGEAEIASLFPDCVLGAVPGFGQAYDVELLWDETLAKQSELFFEAGNHEDLIEINQLEFKRLFEEHLHGVFSLSNEDNLILHADEIRGGVH